MGGHKTSPTAVITDAVKVNGGTGLGKKGGKKAGSGNLKKLREVSMVKLILQKEVSKRQGGREEGVQGGAGGEGSQRG